MYDHLLARPPETSPDLDIQGLFRALCEEVLGTRVAYLMPLGSLASLVGPPLVYPDTAASPVSPLAEIAKAFSTPQTICVPIDPARFSGAMWGVPLWSERGLIGLLLLGMKVSGGIYTQEDMEIGRASGERLIDTQATVAMTRRLMDLQRQNMTESQVLDRRARRVLHDDILPCLHSALLTLSSGETRDAGPETLVQLTDVHRRISDLLREMPAMAAPEVTRLGLIDALRETVEGELETAFDVVTWEMEPGAVNEARSLTPMNAEVLYYAAREALRNAARHARGSQPDRPLHLRLAGRIRTDPSPVFEILIEDDGVGIAEASNTGNGRGLALHSTMMAVIGGSLATESLPGSYTRVSLTLPQVGARESLNQS